MEVATCRAMHKSVLNFVQSTYALLGRPPTQKNKSWKQWKNCLKFAVEHRTPTRQLMARELYGKTCDEMEQSVRQAIGNTNQLYSLSWKLQTILSCWEQRKQMQFGAFAGCRLRWRSGRLQVDVRTSIECSRKPDNCASAMVIQETHSCFE